MFQANLVGWVAVLLAIIATLLWRVLGLFLAERISPEGFLMLWVNAVAYSMVTGVLMLVLINPTGILSTTSLEARLFAFFMGAVVLFFTKNLPISIFVGIAVFSAYLGVGMFFGS